MSDNDLLAKNLKLSPSELYVHNLPKMSNFYTEFVGLQELEKSKNSVVLGHKSIPIIELTEKPALSTASFPSAGLFHNAIVFKSQTHLARRVDKILYEIPENFSGTGDHLVSEAFYFNDPEGNGLELYYDRPADTWQWRDGRVVMDTLYIDPLLYVKKHIAGADVSIENHLGHVHLRVGDIPKARKFYVDLLGFSITADIGSALFVAVGGYHHHIGLNTWFSDGAGARAPALGLGDVRIELPGSKEIEKLAERLEKYNYEFKLKNGVLSVEDPWGNSLVFEAR